MFWEALGIALREIRRNLVRAFLTVLGVVIGVAAVIVMVSLGSGATESVTSQVESLGSNLVIANPGRSMGPGGSSAANFQLSDAEAIAERAGSVEAVAPLRSLGVNVVYLQEDWSAQAMGTTVDYFSVSNWTLDQGRLFTEAEGRAARPVCVLGETLVEELFGAQDPIGAQIRLKSMSCEVIGTLVGKGQGAMGNDQDNVVVLPLSTLQRRLAGRSGSRDVSMIMMSARDGVSSDRVVGEVAEILRERRGIREGEDDDFSVLDTQQIAETLSSTSRILTLLLGAVAGISLLVGGIGIMNIMLVSVTERTREIGIRMSIGALPGEVMLQFLVEAVMLSALGGLVGILLAGSSSYLLSQALDIPHSFDPQIYLVAFTFSAAVGVLFGFVPAKRAAGLDPIDALRHE